MVCRSEKAPPESDPPAETQNQKEFKKIRGFVELTAAFIGFYMLAFLRLYTLMSPVLRGKCVDKYGGTWPCCIL